jgi:hypothetical protein
MVRVDVLAGQHEPPGSFSEPSASASIMASNSSRDDETARPERETRSQDRSPHVPQS